MPVTSEEWETELESVDQVAARDTDPAPPPTEPPAAKTCLCCGLPVCIVCFRSCGQHDAKCTEAP